MTTATAGSVHKERISEAVGYVRSEMEPAVDAFVISRRLGIEVWSDDELPPEVSGVFRKKADFKNPEIFPNELDAHDRRRFTCAHALGHYARNAEIGRGGVWEIVEGRDFFAAELRDVEEIYATEFAAEMLMPRVALREIDDHVGIASLASMFGVTVDVMKFRLDQIGWRR